MAAHPDFPTAPVSAIPTAAPPSIDELDAAICALSRQLNAETYRLLLLVRDFDDRLGWARWGCRNCAEWLAFRCQLSLSAAREKVRTAQALRRMPVISQAFAEGRLSYSKVRALTRVAECHDEQQLVDYALRATAVQVEERCREMRNSKPESVDVARRAWLRRALILRRDPARGTLSISVDLPLEDGEVIAAALEQAVAAGESATGIEFDAAGQPPGIRDSAEPSSSAGNGWLAQQADALVAIAKAYLGGHAEPASAAVSDHHQVVVHVDESALRGGEGRADLPIETVRRLACDGSLITVVEDEQGSPLDVGRKHRAVPTPLRRALLARDRCCAFPGCRSRRWLHAHHIRHWADGGSTALENLVLLCSHHHRLVHEGGFAIRRAPEGELSFCRPDGRVIPSCGYRLEDMVDDCEPVASAERPSAEVRETAPVYALTRRRAAIAERNAA